MTSLARATALMSVGTILSRITGLARLAVVAATLGIAETRLPDTYNLANTAPNIVYELVLGGVLTSVFVPVIVELFEKEGRDRAWEVVSALVNLSIVILTAVAIIGILVSPLIAHIYTFRNDVARQHEVLTLLLRLFIPQIVFYGLTALTAGVLNAHKRFAAPMYTPILNNLAVIAVFIAFRQAYGAVTLANVTTSQLFIIGLGTTAGIALMAIAQLPFLRGLGTYRWTLSARHPSVRKLARLSTYVVGYVVANQIGYLIVQILANADKGAYSAYLYAFTFFIFPHGLFAVSVITALLPQMSAEATHERWEGFRERLSLGIRATFLLILPAAVGYLVLGEQIVRLVVEHGIVTGVSTELVASVLRLFVLGLVPFSMFQLFLRAFYALQDTKTPFLVNCAAVAVNTAINIPMFAWLGVEGLAAGHAAAYVFGTALQARLLSRRIGGLDGARIASSGIRIAAAAAVMGAVVFLSARGVAAVAATGLVAEILGVAVPVGAGALAYVGAAHFLGVDEMTIVWRLARRRPASSRPNQR